MQIGSGLAITNEQYDLYLFGSRVYGVQSVDWTTPDLKNSLKHLGGKNPQYIQSAHAIGEVSVSRTAIGGCPFLGHTGVYPINLSLSQSTGIINYAFTSGYLTSYRHSCEVGGVPQTTVAMNIYNDIEYLASNRNKDDLIMPINHYWNQGETLDYVIDYTSRTINILPTSKMAASARRTADLDSNPSIITYVPPNFKYQAGNASIISNNWYNNIYISGSQSTLNKIIVDFTTGGNDRYVIIHPIPRILDDGFVEYTSGTRNPPEHLATFGSIELNLDGASTNRILSYDLNIECNRTPYYTIRHTKPFRVDLNYPLNVTCRFSLELDQYNAQSMFDNFAKPKSQELNIILKDYISLEEYQRYSFSNMILAEQNFGISTNGNLTLNLLYKTWSQPTHIHPTGASGLMPMPVRPSFNRTVSSVMASIGNDSPNK